MKLDKVPDGLAIKLRNKEITYEEFLEAANER